MGTPNIIAIDGTAASGKSTIAELLAKKLDYLYFDTGVMYRAVTLAALNRAVDLTCEDAITELARTIKIDIQQTTNNDGRKFDVMLDGIDVTWEIRSEAVDENVSVVSAYPGVRVAMTQQQKQIGSKGRIVMAGRDIGTVVLPQADLKIYLDASVESRALRRQKELAARGIDLPYAEILESMIKRDQIDSTRATAPLKPAEDAVVIQTDDLSVQEVYNKVLELL